MSRMHITVGLATVAFLGFSAFSVSNALALYGGGVLVAQQTLEECIDRYVNDSMSKLDPGLSADEKRMEVSMASSMAESICASRIKEQAEEPARLKKICPSKKKSYSRELSTIQAKGLSQAISRTEMQQWIEELNDTLRRSCGEEAERLIQEGQNDGEKMMKKKEKNKTREMRQKAKKKESGKAKKNGKEKKKGKAKVRKTKPRTLEMK